MLVYDTSDIARVPVYEREENNNIHIKLYRANTIEFLTRFNELFFFYSDKSRVEMYGNLNFLQKI